ncbi:ABC transporter ATP-binding protein [Desulfofalx alkaliphila]|uniref:ABC transporter ATP-binding protein n=1 Tax=Desulfofalx alkaliphila TaxID=105483 RepID=UPI0004E1E58B|nr:ABC transporter ATP-binding protein [Desulfofalx alkaliphila]
MVIDAKEVSVIRNGKYILKDVSWSVKAGEHWAILGLNGSGKTTLLNMINGYIFPSKGKLQVLGKTFGRYDLRDLRKSIGWVSSALQEKLYGSESAEDIVLSGKFASIGLFEDANGQDRDLAKNLLESLGIGHLSKRAYKTFSQGEKQRVLIARALITLPPLLILDEPCTGLDIFAREQLLKTIEKLINQDQAPTIIYVTHRTEEILPTFSHTLLLRRGQVYSSGKTDTVLTQENLCGFFETPVSCEKVKGRYILKAVHKA